MNTQTENLTYNEAFDELLFGEASYIARDGQIDESALIMIDEYGEPIVDGNYADNDYLAHDWFIG